MFRIIEAHFIVLIILLVSSCNPLGDKTELSDNFDPGISNDDSSGSSPPSSPSPPSGPSTFNIPFTTAINYTYDSTLIEFYRRSCAINCYRSNR